MRANYSPQSELRTGFGIASFLSELQPIVPSFVFMGGYKLEWNQLFWEMGFAQDYANYGNETDFVIFIETGMQW